MMDGAVRLTKAASDTAVDIVISTNNWYQEDYSSFMARL